MAHNLDKQIDQHTQALHEHLEALPHSNVTTSLTATSIALLNESKDKIEQARKQISALEADRDAAWRLANAAADGHAAIRARYQDLAVMIGAVETDSAADIAHRLAVYIDRQTRSYSDAPQEANARVDELKHRACEMMGWDSDKPTPARTAASGAMSAIERQELTELRQLAAANAEVLRRQGVAFATLQAVLATAGAPKDTDLTAWASNVRNTILGQRREIEELVERLRNNDTARRHEIAEIKAAADSLPEPLKHPYAIMATTPVQVFMLLRERALALVNPAAPAPVSGA